MIYNEDLYYWIKKWCAKEKSFSENVYFSKNNEKNLDEEVFLPQNESNEVITLLQEKGLLERNSKVLDIGCGLKRHSLIMAKECKEVIALDISQKMLQYLKLHAKEIDLSHMITCEKSWEEINLSEYRWEKRFDLVFASMAPGVNSFSTLQKMLEASRNYCYLSGFLHCKNHLWDALSKEILTENLIEKQREDKIYYAFNILWSLGYHPEILYNEKNWQQQWSLEEINDLYIKRFESSKPLEKVEKDKVKEFLSDHQKDGKVVEKIEAKTAALIWRV